MAHDRLRFVNKHFFNPIMRRVARLPFAPIGVIYHRGRKSGKEYATPVIPWRVGQDFVFALTYGPEVDWFRNVMAAGGCRLRWRGQSFALTQPTMLTRAEGLQLYPLPFRPILRLVNTRHFVQMQRRG